MIPTVLVWAEFSSFSGLDFWVGLFDFKTGLVDLKTGLFEFVAFRGRLLRAFWNDNCATFKFGLEKHVFFKLKKEL